MATDKLTTTLAQIQDRVTRRDSDLSQCAAADLTRLLGVVKAVLALAAKLGPQAPPPSALEEDRMWIRQECADMIREAITTTLLEETANA